MSEKIIEIQKIGFQLETESPFLACMHHVDYYPKGDVNLGPDISLEERQLGQDFSGKNGFSMYHGTIVPGFPAHPHRGFETVTVVLKGFVDHFDSKGSQGRYGNGDVQWLTTGKGCQHAEMFPMVNRDRDNTLELFQIWLNLSASNKFVEPEYKMLWSEEIPNIEIKDNQENKITIKIIAGSYQGTQSLKPTQASWAESKENHVNIMVIEMDPKTVMSLPAISKTMNRNLYYYSGNESINIDGQRITASHRIKLSGSDEISIINGEQKSYLLLLEGEPINEPVAQYGPFVMNTAEEIQQAFSDYQETEFGGWPWTQSDPVHERNKNRFAKYSDGRIENKE